MKPDNELQRDVLDELERDPSLHAAEIGVIAKDGVVTLSGHLDHFGEKWTAEHVAQKVYGVKAVANELKVEPFGLGRRTDADIARAVVNRLERNGLVPHEAITVAVSDGWIKLEGEVDWRFQRIAAEEETSQVAGVSGLTNLITVKPKTQPTGVKAETEAALERDAKWGGTLSWMPVDLP